MTRMPPHATSVAAISLSLTALSHSDSESPLKEGQNFLADRIVCRADVLVDVPVIAALDAVHFGRRAGIMQGRGQSFRLRGGCRTLGDGMQNEGPAFGADV
ncbi:hypothetical protein E6W36_11420 [Hankyongella ginsenosidimutans]|uniref:Uncharacterized protein n=1 Tax=Hankyongella ginsenosidimutans TaxID=1763828 RepID=A0A4D7CC79_9SPHN|nr:hypothetical protein [Hankyongella ginsenosidimutans]QCI79892.1 hypothetical protein E6W36_11420 [Hankyongella ginsenosidimutans]